MWSPCSLCINFFVVTTPPPPPQILSLRHNRLTGTVPPDLGRLGQLKTLYMEKNQLEGTIPDTLANLASLEELNLLGNQFQGDLTEEQRRRRRREKIDVDWLLRVLHYCVAASFFFGGWLGLWK